MSPIFARAVWLRQNARLVNDTVLSNPHRYSWFLQDSVYHIVPSDHQFKSFFDKRREWLEEFLLSFPNLRNIIFYCLNTDLEKIYFEYHCVKTMLALEGHLYMILKYNKRYDFSKTLSYNGAKMNKTNLYICSFAHINVPNSLNGTVGPLELEYLEIAFMNLSLVTEMLKCLSSIQKCGVMNITVDVNMGNFSSGIGKLAIMLENIPTAVDHLDLLFKNTFLTIDQLGRLQETLVNNAENIGTILKNNLVLDKVRDIKYHRGVSKSFVDTKSIIIPFKEQSHIVKDIY